MNFKNRNDIAYTKVNIKSAKKVDGKLELTKAERNTLAKAVRATRASLELPKLGKEEMESCIDKLIKTITNAKKG